MRKFTFVAILIAVILFFGGGINTFGQSNSNKTIVLITDVASNGGDVAQYNWLMANGFMVTKLDVTKDINLMAPDQADIDALNASDLVIIGRDVNSSKYDGAGQDVIDNITVPVITCNPYGAQWGNPPLWFTTPEVVTLSNKNIYVKTNGDPIFVNSHAAGDSVNFAYKGCAFITTPGAHNGSVLATNAGNMGVVRFAKNVPYNPEVGAKTPKSDRTVFSFQNTATSFSLTPDGQAAYYAEIRQMVGLSIEAPKVYSGNNSDRIIVLITDVASNGGDVAQYNWLMANGYKVTKLDVTKDINLMAPDQSDIDALNAADLVIIGRDVNSSKYDGAGQDVIDNITAPVITCNPYGAQWGNPPLWFTTPEVVTLSAKNIYVKTNGDPIFSNSHVTGDSVNFAYKGCAFITTPGAHNGSVLATNTGNMGVVRFAKGVPYNPEAVAKTPKSDRTVFSFQNTATSFSLTLDGQAAYYAEIRQKTGLAIEAPKVYSANTSDKSIVLLTDPAHGGDLALTSFLTNNGLKITTINVTDAMIGSPTPAFQAQLDAADVIVYGRDAWSNVQNAIDATITPVIQTNTFGAQWGAPDKFWFLNASMNVPTDPTFFKIHVTNDPIFANSHIVGNELKYATQAAFVTTADPHNGTVIGDFGGDAGIVRFVKNVPYNSDPAAKTPKSDHTLFPLQTGPSSMTLSDDAQAALLAEIQRMAGLPITAPTYYYYNNSLDTIVLLTDPAHGNDDAQYTWLKGNGFTVTRVNVGSDVSLITPTQATLDILNAADLVIAGRDAFSSTYDGNGQDVLDNLTVPLITDNPYGAQWGVPKMWYPDGSVSDVVTDTLWLKIDKTDPIFSNCKVVGDSVLLYSSSKITRLIGSTATGGAHNGSIVGQIGNDSESGLVIVRFAKNVPYNSASGAKTPKGDRTNFPWESGPKSWTLSKDGQSAYYAEINRLLGHNIQAPAFYYENPSSVSSLASIVPSVGTMEPVFSPAETSYTLAVPEGTASVTLTVTTTDPNATVVGDGEITGIPTTAFITVTAADGVTITDYAVDISFAVGLKDFTKADLSIYPNPARDNVMVNGLTPGARFTIINSAGQTISKTIVNDKQMQLNLGYLKSGIYMIKVEKDGKSYSAKFIKQ